MSYVVVHFHSRPEIQVQAQWAAEKGKTRKILVSFPVRAACWRFWWRSSQITPSFTEPAPFRFQFSGHLQWSSCELHLILAAMLLTLTVTVSVTCCSWGTGSYRYANLAVFISLLEIKQKKAEKQQQRWFWPCPVDEGIFHWYEQWSKLQTSRGSWE